MPLRSRRAALAHRSASRAFLTPHPLALSKAGMKEHIPGTAEHRATHPPGAGVTGQASGPAWLALPWTWEQRTLKGRVLSRPGTLQQTAVESSQPALCTNPSCAVRISPQVKSHVPGTAEHAARGTEAGYAGTGVGTTAGERYGEGYEKTAYPSVGLVGGTCRPIQPLPSGARLTISSKPATCISHSTCHSQLRGCPPPHLARYGATGATGATGAYEGAGAMPTAGMGATGVGMGATGMGYAEQVNAKRFCTTCLLPLLWCVCLVAFMPASVACALHLTLHSIAPETLRPAISSAFVLPSSSIRWRPLCRLRGSPTQWSPPPASSAPPPQWAPPQASLAVVRVVEPGVRSQSAQQWGVAAMLHHAAARLLHCNRHVSDDARPNHHQAPLPRRRDLRDLRGECSMCTAGRGWHAGPVLHRSHDCTALHLAPYTCR